MASDYRIKWRRLVGVVALLVLPYPLSAGSEVRAISNRQSELQKLQGEITTLQDELSHSQRQRQELRLQLRTTEQRMGITARHLRELSGSLEKQQQRLKLLQRERSGQMHELERNRKSLAQQMRSAYAMGRQERVKILLNQQDPAVVSRMLVYYDYFNRARSDQIGHLGKVLEDLRQTEDAWVVEQQQMREMQARELEQQHSLDQDRQQRRKVLALLNQEIKSKHQQLEGYKRDEQQLQLLVQRLQNERAMLPDEIEKHRSFKSLKGHLTWPTKGRLVTRFGQFRAGNLKWDGVVIAAQEGREVKAVHHGRVAFADWLRGFGLLLIIDHGDGYMSLYGHNQSLFKDVGEWVEPGEPVALVGNSGGQANPGVYFGIRYKGRPVNPSQWCEAIRGNRVGLLQRDGLSGSAEHIILDQTRSKTGRIG